ncbi:HD-GYP domain-containing protein [Gluconacetobacter sp.]|uniref:HD-GYP domain-containing protein n=1 Tax=Gluconacetobacter sp. TaxID=1935994 RepID=UPI0039E7D2B0
MLDFPPRLWTGLASGLLLPRALLVHPDLDPDGHGARVGILARAIGLPLMPGVPGDRLELAGCMHDVGKIFVPPEILNKPGSLTMAERTIMNRHPVDGAWFLSAVRPDLHRDVLDAALYHHEDFDGRGYPCGLTAQRIPLVARIIAVADAIDALLSPRVYRPAWVPGRVRHYLVARSGTRLDPLVVSVAIDRFDTLLMLRQGRGKRRAKLILLAERET